MRCPLRLKLKNSRDIIWCSEGGGWQVDRQHRCGLEGGGEASGGRYLRGSDDVSPGHEPQLLFHPRRGDGSTLCILGRNNIQSGIAEEEQEYPVVGGTGIFRYAKGYALSTTYSDDVEAGHRVVLYTFHMSYYEFHNSPYTTRSS